MPVTELEVLRNHLATFREIRLFEGDDEALNVAFINALCSTLQAKLLKYYGTSGSAEDRLQRLGEISLLFREMQDERLSIAAKRGTAERSIAPLSMMDSLYSADDPFICPEGTRCIDGNCV